MEGIDPIALAAQLAMGLALAACAGLRAFLPPLALAVAARAGIVSLSADLAWLASTPAIVVLGSAVAIELIGDKIPVVDHFLDAAGTVLRPLAGAAVASIPLIPAALDRAGGDGNVTWAWAVAIASAAAGGTISAGVHLLKTHARIGSSLLSGGILNPVLSVVEDLLGVAGVVMAILVPLVAIALAALAVATAAALLRRRRWRAVVGAAGNVGK